MKYRIEKKFSGKFLYIGDNEKELKYDISGYENLREVYSESCINENDLTNLIEELAKMGRYIEDEHLDNNAFLASPDYIFIKSKPNFNTNNNPKEEKKDIIFIYYPEESDARIETSLLRLAEFLIEKTDYTNQNAINIAYGFYMQVYKGDYVFDTSLWRE